MRTLKKTAKKTCKNCNNCKDFEKTAKKLQKTCQQTCKAKLAFSGLVGRGKRTATRPTARLMTTIMPLLKTYYGNAIMSQKQYYGLKSVTKSPSEVFYLNEIVEYVNRNDRYDYVDRWRKGVIVSLHETGINHVIGLMEYQEGTPVTALNCVANNQDDLIGTKDWKYIRKLEGQIYVRPVDNPYLVRSSFTRPTPPGS